MIVKRCLALIKPLLIVLLMLPVDANELVEPAGDTGADEKPEDGTVHFGTRSLSGSPLLTSGFSFLVGARPLSSTFCTKS